MYTMPQSSGSVYHLHEGNEHVSGIMGGVFLSYAGDAADSNGEFKIEMVEFADLPTVFP
jgi:hypothetical protein